MVNGEKDRDLVGRTNVQNDHGYRERWLDSSMVQKWEMMIERSSSVQRDISSGVGVVVDSSVRWDTSSSAEVDASKTCCVWALRVPVKLLA